MRTRVAATVVAASALAGGAIGLTLFGPSAVGAKSGSTTTTVQPAPSIANHGGAKAPGARAGDHGWHDFGGPGFGGRGFGGRHEAVSDASVVAKAIGISEADLTNQLRAGKTIAQVATAHGVATQKVIDALVADAKTELAADVKAGRLTQAQADKLQTDVKQRVTNQVNGTSRMGRGPDGHGYRFGHPGP